MKSSAIILRVVLAFISVFFLGSCFPLVTGNGSYSVKQDDPRWGQMRPGDHLICLNRKFLHKGDWGVIALDPFWEPFEKNGTAKHNEPAVIGHLNAGDSLTLRKIKFNYSITTSWQIVYTTDKLNRDIHVVTPGPIGEWFDSKEWERMGFRLEYGTSQQKERANKSPLPTGMSPVISPQPLCLGPTGSRCHFTHPLCPS